MRRCWYHTKYHPMFRQMLSHQKLVTKYFHTEIYHQIQSHQMLLNVITPNVHCPSLSLSVQSVHHPSGRVDKFGTDIPHPMAELQNVKSKMHQFSAFGQFLYGHLWSPWNFATLLDGLPVPHLSHDQTPRRGSLPLALLAQHRGSFISDILLSKVY